MNESSTNASNPVSDVDRYLNAATRDNTRKAYRLAIEHFESKWGGFLPATADSVSRYLADYADSLSVNTLKQRLAALGRWHTDQGFPDPTKAPVVKSVLKGIRELHPAQEKRAKPLQLERLGQVVEWLDLAIQNASEHNDRKNYLTYTRNKALLLVGFWRGFRADELTRLRVEYIELVAGEGMTLFLPRSKTDWQNDGRSFHVPALSRLCPVSAYQDWVSQAHLEEGPVFSAINQWGHVSDKPLHPDSIIPIFRKTFAKAGLPSDSYSSHSLRRGFATWAAENDWDIQTLMQYVGWKDIKSAMRYIDIQKKVVREKIENAVSRDNRNL